MNASGLSPGRWPKTQLELNPEENVIKEQICLEMQQWGYTGLLGWVQAQGHRMAERLSHGSSDSVQPLYSLEIGCGSGHHFRYARDRTYYGLDRDIAHLRRAQSHHPTFVMVQGNAYDLPFKASTFDRVISIYVFEHLHRLPDCLREVSRVLKPGGELLVALPAEGGLAYEWGRRLTSKRYFEGKYAVDYLKLVRSEHCNSYREIVEALHHWFIVDKTSFLSFRIPVLHLNAIVVLRCVNPRPKNTS